VLLNDRGRLEFVILAKTKKSYSSIAMLSFDYTMAADPRYFQESSTREEPNDSKCSVGEVMFDLPVQERVW
jgi:hypothetical protein